MKVEMKHKKKRLPHSAKIELQELDLILLLEIIKEAKKKSITLVFRHQLSFIARYGCLKKSKQMRWLLGRRAILVDDMMLQILCNSMRQSKNLVIYWSLVRVFRVLSQEWGTPCPRVRSALFSFHKVRSPLVHEHKVSAR